jgi:transposase
MPISIYQKKNIQDKKKQAVKLYKQGLTTRQVGKLLNRSHNWVAMALHELSTPTIA